MTDVGDALDATHALLTRYVVFALPEQADAVALWVAHTWFYDQAECTPYLNIRSAQKESGKTRLFEVIAFLVREPVTSGRASLAALFRMINEVHPTILFDESDATFNKKGSELTEDLRGMLNNGYRRGFPYLRVVGEGKKMRVERFDVFCPKALAGIGSLPDTVQSRSIVVTLKRKSRSERVEPFRLRHAQRQSASVREHWEGLADIVLPDELEMPAGLGDRAADSWEPLIAIGEVAGDEWAARARHAALVLSGSDELEEEPLSIRLLAAIRAASTSSRLIA